MGIKYLTTHSSTLKSGVCPGLLRACAVSERWSLVSREPVLKIKSAMAGVLISFVGKKILSL